jgi:hypothetical protein
MKLRFNKPLLCPVSSRLCLGMNMSPKKKAASTAKRRSKAAAWFEFGHDRDIAL